MKIDKLESMKAGWFVGNFQPTLLPNPHAEVACKHYKAGDAEPRHLHKIATELTLVVTGKIRMNNQILNPGDVITLAPNESSDFLALEDSITIAVKSPSIKGDKYPAEPAAAARDFV